MYIDNVHIDAPVSNQDSFCSRESGDYLCVSGSNSVVILQSEGITYSVPLATGEEVPLNYADVNATGTASKLYADSRPPDTTADTSTYKLFGSMDASA